MTVSQDPKIPVFALERAAEVFAVLATPIRLKIIGELCEGEQNVTQLLAQIGSSQPNMSRHLSVLHQAGVVAKRRSGQQVFYRIANDSVVLVCKAVCSQVGEDMTSNSLKLTGQVGVRCPTGD